VSIACSTFFHSKNHLIFRWMSVPPSKLHLSVPLQVKISDWQSSIRCADLSHTMRAIDSDSDDPKLEWTVVANAAYGVGSIPAASTQIQLFFPAVRGSLLQNALPEQIVLNPDQTPCVLDPLERSQPLGFNCSLKHIESIPEYKNRLKDLQFRYGPPLSSACARSHIT
jgi:hypothetical protein